MLRRAVALAARAGADRLRVQRRPGGRAARRPRPTSRRRRRPPRPRRPSGSASSRAGGRRGRELERAARLVGRMSLPDLAGQVIVAEWRGTAAPVAMVRGLHLGGVIAFSDNVASTGQVRSVNATLDARRTPPVAAVPVRRPGGRDRRAGQGRRHPLPDLHVRRRRAGPAGDDGGPPRQRRGAARPRLRRGLRPGRRRDVRARRPHHRVALGGLGPAAGQQPGRGGRGRGSSGRRWCRCSSTSPATGRCRRTATSRCRCRRAPSSSSWPSTSSPSPPRSRRACRR